MASLIPYVGEAKPLHTPLTLTALQTHVGGFIKFIDLPSGDLMVINEASPLFPFVNQSASKIAGQVINGHVVVCEPSEIA